MNKAMLLATTAMTVFMGATPITAFAHGSDAKEVIVSESVVETSEEVAENVTETEEELPYSYTIDEDGNIVFSFNGEEYVYGEEDDVTGEVVTRGSRLNVRTGAGMDYEVIDQLCPGEEVSVIGTEGDWYQITVPAKTGFVHSDYLEVLENATNETDAMLLQMFMMMFMDGMNQSDYGPLTPDGNMNLIDDYGSATKEGKQFITLTTKNGNYFYLIIDRDDKGQETVHFLNLVDEADLLSLMEEDEVEAYTKTEEVTEPETTETEEPTEEVTETEEPVEMGKVNPIVLAPLAIVLIGAGIAYYFNMKKKKEESEEKPDPDADYEDDSMLDYMDEEEEEELLEEEEFIEEDED